MQNSHQNSYQPHICHLLKSSNPTGDNFSVLKDTSTSTPIQIVNFLSEFSNQHKKPLWLVTQDMKKAYDSVSTSQLIKAIERVHIHPNYIKLINNIQKQRTNSVSTRFGNTTGYQVLDGIDQR